jgi:APA family basic amino acid/polyamine antiporter
LLDYVISVALIFYVLTIWGVIRLRRKDPNAARPYRVWGYPAIPLIYIFGGTVVLLCLFAFRPATTWPGLLIVLCGLPVYWISRKSRN